MPIEFWVWLGVIVVAVVVEMITLDLVAIWFAAGAVVPFILSAFEGTPLWLEIVLFVVASGLLIAFMRKVAQKLLYKNSDGKTNTDMFKGQTRKLLKSITYDKSGAINFNGVVWTAITEDGSEIKAGQYVDVLRIQGNKIIVKRSNKKAETQTRITSIEKIKTEETIKETSEEIAEEKGE
ncbi:MAG: NfeD family protein [Clostridia bacterium]|nr:NfeD family protein [Clostridia bacterium]